MARSIIHDIEHLMSVSDDELTEILLQDKYNKALLRELVRRSLRTAKEYKMAWEYEKDDRKDTEEYLKNYE